MRSKSWARRRAVTLSRLESSRHARVAILISAGLAVPADMGVTVHVSNCHNHPVSLGFGGCSCVPLHL